MSCRVALVGEPRATGFAAARFRHFRSVIEGAGHEVLTVDAGAESANRAESADRAESPDQLGADVVVSAGVYGPTEVAVRIAGERPLWLDWPGDPFADGQAVVARGGDPLRVAEDCARVFLPALARADAFSTIGDVSAHTLIGQLGMLGRWVGPDQLTIATIPIAWPGSGATLTATGGADRTSGPVRVLLSGSFNTWFDDDAVAAVLEGAMERSPVEVDVTGGPGQPGGYARFVERFKATGAVRFHGWLPDPRAVTEACEVLLTLDRRDVWEPLCGSRTRVLTGRASGLRVVASAGPQLITELAARGQVRAVTSTEAAIAAILDRTPPPDPAWIAERYDPVTVARPLLAWLRSPRRAPGFLVERPLELALRGRERAERELAALRRTWAFRLGRLGRR
ncbi:MAG: hypothetical protein EXR69_16745 [Myxococcales bacterium]|nr:hypothetical protein [Myxococcales bacterium]